jgi:hypothetical protein
MIMHNAFRPLGARFYKALRGGMNDKKMYEANPKPTREHIQKGDEREEG